MLYPSISSLLKNTDSRYSLVIAVAKRARNISEFAEAQGMSIEDKPVKIAISEISEGSVTIRDLKDEDEFVHPQ